MPILLILLFLTAHFASKLLIAFGFLFCSKFCLQIWSRPRGHCPLFRLLCKWHSTVLELLCHLWKRRQQINNRGTVNIQTWELPALL